jgi:Reverse transcriptase (RNA-dependent DNA polymerase)
MYKIKICADGLINRYKAHLVAKEYKYKYGIDYDEVFAPAARFDTVKMLISLALYYSWKLHQLNVKSAFFNSVIEKKFISNDQNGSLSKELRRRCIV